MLWPRTDWQIGLSSPQKALEWADSFIAYGRPAQALELLKQANQKFPSDPSLQGALHKVQQLNHEDIATRNGPNLLAALFAFAFLLWACGFAATGIVQAPWPVKLICAILLAGCVFGLYAVGRHAIARWRMKI